MKRITAPAIFIITALLVFNGCKKQTPDTETTSATDNAICEGEFMRVLPTVNKITIDENGVHRYSNPVQTESCPTVSVTGSNFPVVMTIDYGTGCTDPVDGKVRKGKIVCTFNNHWDTIGTTVNIVLDSFWVNNIHFEGTVDITRLSANSFRKVIQNGKCSTTGNNPWSILWNCDRTITYTTDPNDSTAAPVISISGSNNGTNRNGETWTADIDSSHPIVRDMNCPWITKGIITLTPQGKAARTINFGDGNCDNKATITINGSTFEFTMQ